MSPGLTGPQAVNGDTIIWVSAKSGNVRAYDMIEARLCEVVSWPLTLTRCRYFPFLEPRRDCGIFMKFLNSPRLRDKIDRSTQKASFEAAEKGNSSQIVITWPLRWYEEPGKLRKLCWLASDASPTVPRRSGVCLAVPSLSQAGI